MFGVRVTVFMRVFFGVLIAYNSFIKVLIRFVVRYRSWDYFFYSVLLCFTFRRIVGLGGRFFRGSFFRCFYDYERSLFRVFRFGG